MLLQAWHTFQMAIGGLLGFCLFALLMLITFIAADELADRFRAWRHRRNPHFTVIDPHRSIDLAERRRDSRPTEVAR